jgi:glyoxylase-like metal-dependent hydrolase (beta-lactamase superfamily II)
VFQRDAAPGIHRIEDSYVNWFIVEDGSRLTVIDAGVPTSWNSLLDALSRLGRSKSDIEALVLTHAHFDHVGFAERARTELGIPVFAHTGEEPVTRHPLRYKRERSPLLYPFRHPKALPIVAAFARNGVLRTPGIGAVTTYADGDVLGVPGSPRVVATPGHTLGHCSLMFPEADALIAGDAVVMLNPYTGDRGPQLVARAATADSSAALASLDRIAETAATTVLTGHGEVWRAGAAQIAEAARARGLS